MEGSRRYLGIREGDDLEEDETEQRDPDITCLLENQRRKVGQSLGALSLDHGCNGGDVTARALINPEQEFKGTCWTRPYTRWERQINQELMIIKSSSCVCVCVCRSCTNNRDTHSLIQPRLAVSWRKRFGLAFDFMNPSDRRCALNTTSTLNFLANYSQKNKNMRPKNNP